MMRLVMIAKERVGIPGSFLQTCEITCLACLVGIIPVGRIYLFPRKQTPPVDDRLGSWGDCSVDTQRID